MLTLRIDLYVHNADESRIDKKLDDILDVVKALGDDPVALAALTERLEKSKSALKNAIDSAPPVP